MTVREAYQDILREIKKHKAPAFYVEDFVRLFYKAQYNRFNKLYSLYEKSQILSDDLQNLSEHIYLDLTNTNPFPLNLTNYDGTPYITFPTYTYLISGGYPAITHPTPQISTFAELNSTYPGGNNRRSIFAYQDATTLRDNITNPIYFVYVNAVGIQNIDRIVLGENIPDKTIMKVVGTNDFTSNYTTNAKLYDYRSYGNDNTLEYGLDFGENGSATVKNMPGEDNPLYFQWDATRKMWRILTSYGFEYISDDTSVVISAPPNYWHLLDITNWISKRQSIECDIWRDKKYPAKRLNSDNYTSIRNNSWLEPKIKMPYFKELNSVINEYPKFEVLFCANNEKDLVRLNRLEILFLKEPKKFSLVESDIEGQDNTEVLPYPEYICQELVQTSVTLLLERTTDPRIQTYPQINESNIARADGYQQQK